MAVAAIPQHNTQLERLQTNLHVIITLILEPLCQTVSLVYGKQLLPLYISVQAELKH